MSSEQRFYTKTVSIRTMKILSICGSPRKGNSETVIRKLKGFFETEGIENEIILLREKDIQRCEGCVEYCNHNLKCKHNDDMIDIRKKMLEADGYVFVMPNYFAMPPGLFKDFVDKCSIFYTAKIDLSSKKALVIIVGTDQEFIDSCAAHVAQWFCGTLKIDVIDKKSFLSRSELNGNYNDIFENEMNPNIKEELKKAAKKLVVSLQK